MNPGRHLDKANSLFGEHKFKAVAAMLEEYAAWRKAAPEEANTVLCDAKFLALYEGLQVVRLIKKTSRAFAMLTHDCTMN